LEHRTAVTGTQPLAMYDAHAAHLAMERIDQELPQCLLGLGDREPVQIDLALDPILAAAQPAQHRRLHARALVDQLLAAGERGIGRLGAEALLQHRSAVSARAAPASPLLRSPHRRGAAGERLDAAYRVAEELCGLTRIVRVVV